MGTASFQFIAFAMIAAAAYNLFSALAWRQVCLLVTNALFLYTFVTNVQSILPFLSFLCLGFAAARATQEKRWRWAYVPLLFLVVCVFVWLKKYSILPQPSLLNFSYVTIGLSYILFRVLHLIVEARADAVEQRIDLVSYLNYTLNFMTLVSGPIQRYDEFTQEHLAPIRPRFDLKMAGNGLHRIVTGFFEVAVLSWALFLFHKSELALLSTSQSAGEKILTAAAIAVSYTLYLYFNFSGYISIVIGIGRFFRFHLPENFSRPLFADSFIEFWNRWHITLSRWLKTYVYNPLLLFSMRRLSSPAWAPFFSVAALFFTFFLIGIWHGRTSEFVTFGFLQGLGVAVNQLYRIFAAKWIGKDAYDELLANPLYTAICRGLTFTWFTFTLLWFWADWKQLKQMANVLHLTGILAALLLTLLGATVVLTILSVLREWALSFRYGDSPFLVSRYFLTVVDTALVVLAVCVVLLFTTHNPELVYDAF